MYNFQCDGYRKDGGCYEAIEQTEFVGSITLEWVWVGKEQIAGRGDTVCKVLEGRRSLKLLMRKPQAQMALLVLKAQDAKPRFNT